MWSVPGRDVCGENIATMPGIGTSPVRRLRLEWAELDTAATHADELLIDADDAAEEVDTVDGQPE